MQSAIGWPCMHIGYWIRCCHMLPSSRDNIYSTDHLEIMSGLQGSSQSVTTKALDLLDPILQSRDTYAHNTLYAQLVYKHIHVYQLYMDDNGTALPLSTMIQVCSAWHKTCTHSVKSRVTCVQRAAAFLEECKAQVHAHVCVWGGGRGELTKWTGVRRHWAVNKHQLPKKQYLSKVRQPYITVWKLLCHTRSQVGRDPISGTNARN